MIKILEVIKIHRNLLSCLKLNNMISTFSILLIKYNKLVFSLNNHYIVQRIPNDVTTSNTVIIR